MCCFIFGAFVSSSWISKISSRGCDVGVREMRWVDGLMG
jgi:hypothetical protein